MHVTMGRSREQKQGVDAANRKPPSRSLLVRRLSPAAFATLWWFRPDKRGKQGKMVRIGSSAIEGVGSITPERPPSAPLFHARSGSSGGRPAMARAATLRGICRPDLQWPGGLFRRSIFFRPSLRIPRVARLGRCPPHCTTVVSSLGG